MKELGAASRVAGLAVYLVAASPGAATAERARPSGTTEYQGQNQCGIVDVTRMPPFAHARGDVDGDGVVDHFIANWGGVERERVQRDSIPETLVRVGTVYTSTATPQYSCVDLRLVDLDGDGDLDMIFASPRELVVLENRGGRFTVIRREPQSLDPHAMVLVQARYGAITLTNGAAP